MAKLKARARALARGGSVISASDSGGTTNDIQAGDLIGLCRKRGTGAWTLLNRKDVPPTPMSVTIPAALATIVDAFGVEANFHVLFRALDEAGLTDAQKAAILDKLNDGTLLQTDENPWA